VLGSKRTMPIRKEGTSHDLLSGSSASQDPELFKTGSRRSTVEKKGAIIKTVTLSGNNTRQAGRGASNLADRGSQLEAARE